MKKKLFMLMFALCVIGGVKTYALGIGVQYGGQYYQAYGGYISSVAFLLSPKDDLHFSLSYLYTNNEGGMSITGDYWLLEPVITEIGSGGKDGGSLRFFFGVGFFADFDFKLEHFHGGGRIPLGLDLKFPKFDVFLQVAPTWGLQFVPSIALIGGTGLGGSGSLGVRVWFL